MHYALYTAAWQSGIDHAALCAHNREHGDLLARAENSGCEGHYVEVARWSYKRERWERYCHCKFLGGDDRERADWPPKKLAEHYAREINDAYNDNQADLALIHKLPNWAEDDRAPSVENPWGVPDLGLALAETYLLFRQASEKSPVGPIVAATADLAEAMRSFGHLPEEAERVVSEHKGVAHAK